MSNQFDDLENFDLESHDPSQLSLFRKPIDDTKWLAERMAMTTDDLDLPSIIDTEPQQTVQQVRADIRAKSQSPPAPKKSRITLWIVLSVIMVILVAVGVTLWFVLQPSPTGNPTYIGMLNDSMSRADDYFTGTESDALMGIHFHVLSPIAITHVGVWNYTLNQTMIADNKIHIAPVKSPATVTTTQDSTGTQVTLVEPDETSSEHQTFSRSSLEGTFDANNQMTWFALPQSYLINNKEKLNKNYMVYVKRTDGFRYQILSAPGHFFDSATTWNPSFINPLPMTRSDAPFLATMGANFKYQATTPVSA